MATIRISFVNFMSPKYLTNYVENNIGKTETVPYTSNPDILFVSVFEKIPLSKIAITKSKIKIFVSGENLDRFPKYKLENIDKIFDLIVGFYDTNLDGKIIRFPLWLMYYEYYKWDDQDNILSYIQNKYNENIKKKKSVFGSIVCRHDRGGIRSRIYDELSKYGKINSPSAFKKNTPAIGSTKDDKILYISNSLYHICPENSASEKYFTEKIFHAFEGGTIPLYWAVGYPEPEIINKNKYCFINVNDTKSIQESIRHVTSNRDLYLNGGLFTENAANHIKIFYSTLLNSIVTKLQYKN